MIWHAFINMVRSFLRPAIPTLRDQQDQCELSEMPRVVMNNRGEWVTVPRWHKGPRDGD